MKAFKKMVAMGVFLLSGTVSASPELVFKPLPDPIMVGDVFNLVLTGRGFDATDDGGQINNVSGGQKLDLQFSADKLVLLNTLIDPVWNFPVFNKVGVADNVTGSLIGLGFGTFPPVESDTFNIATFTFKALVPGLASIDVTNAEIAATVDNIASSRLSANLGRTSIQITAVPIPGALWLFGSAIGLVTLARKRKFDC